MSRGEIPPHTRNEVNFLRQASRKQSFWCRPLDEPQTVTIARPLVGDEPTIAKLLGVAAQHNGMTLKQIAAHDTRWRNAAMAKGYDAIVLMAPEPFAKFRTTGKLPRSIELKVLNVR